MNVRVSGLVISIAAAVTAGAQGLPTPTWHLFDPVTGPIDGQARVVKQDPAGNVIVLAQELGPTDADNRMVLRKFTPLGTLIWTRTLTANNGPGAFPRGMDIDAQGNIVTVGTQIGDGLGTDPKSFMVVYRPDGSIKFSRLYDFSTGGSLNEGLQDVAVDQAGVIYGLAEFDTPTGPDVGVRAVSPNGDVLWDSTFSDTSASFEEAAGVRLDRSGRVYIFGRTERPGRSRTFLVSMNTQTGARVYERTPNLFVTNSSVAVTPDGFVVLVGGVDSVGRILSYRPDGSVRFDTSLSRTNEPVFLAALALEPDGGFVVAGETGRSIQGIVGRFRSDGVRRWSKVFGTVGAQVRASGVAADPVGNLYVMFASEVTPFTRGFAKWSTSGTKLFEVNHVADMNPNAILRNDAGDIGLFGTRLIGGIGRTAVIWYRSPVTLSSASVRGGSSVRLRVTLRDLAPSGGVTVNLSDDRPELVLPASVTVPAGQRSVEFTVASTAVPTTTRVTVNANAGLNTTSATVVLTP